MKDERLKTKHSTCAYPLNSNVLVSTREGLLELLGVRPVTAEEKYLGLPALFGWNKREILNYLRQRVIKRIQSLNNRFLSRAGTEVLLKTVIQAMPLYAMNVLLLPNELCRELEILMNGYWWTGNTGKGIQWRDWKSLCKPKKFGGLDFRRVRQFNVAMLAKQA